MTARRLPSAVAGLALAALLALSGCVSIPASGPVLGTQFGDEDTGADLGFRPAEPQAGATQEEILEGFIAAGLGPESLYKTARTFLSSDFSSKWNPNASVVITDGARGIVNRVGDTTLSMLVEQTAALDGSGQYVESEESTPVESEFQFVQEDGEWRIASAPDATFLAPNNFLSVFSDYPLYFFDPSAQFLVPDLRWFPTLPTTADRIARGLLNGPTEWLGSGAVLSAFPEGTQLVDAVVVEAGLATVDLSSDVLAASNGAKRRMVQQLEASLRGLDRVQRVEITVNGLVVTIPGGQSVAPPTAPEVESSPFVLRDGAVGFVAGDGVDALPGLSDAITALAPTAMSLSRDQGSAAVRDGQGRVLLVGSDGDPLLVDSRSGLIAPTIDPQGYVWTVPAGSPELLQASNGRDAPLVVGSTQSPPSTGSVVTAQLSRDGTRLLLALDGSSGPELFVAAVLRDGSFAPTALGPFVAIPIPASGTLVDATWVDSLSIATMTSEGSTVAVRSVQVGGRMTTLSQPGSGVQLVGGYGGTEGLRIRTDEGVLLRQNAAGRWQSSVDGVSLLGTQQ